MLIKQFTKEADGIQEVRGSIPLISTRKEHCFGSALSQYKFFRKLE
jgi:hypothetical protein